MEYARLAIVVVLVTIVLAPVLNVNAAQSQTICTRVHVCTAGSPD